MLYEQSSDTLRAARLVLRLDRVPSISPLDAGNETGFRQHLYSGYARYRERAERLVTEWRRAYARRHEPVPPFVSHITDGVKVPDAVRIRAHAFALQPERDDHVARRNARRLAGRPHLRQRPRSLLPRARG